ncbi:MAG: DVUA0089 family protein, partial [Cyanobacteria bacterium P01_H01_bin.152]
SATPLYNGVDAAYSIEIPDAGQNNRIVFGNYELDIDLLTPGNPRKTGTPTPPVSNPDVTNPPTLFLEASPLTEDSEGNITPGVVEFVEDTGSSEVNFTIRAEGDIPEGGIEFVLNSNANLFDYVAYQQQDTLPSTVGGQSLGAFYNSDGVPTGIRLLLEEPTMIVTLQAALRTNFLLNFLGIGPYLDSVYEPLETDGAENVSFFLQPGEGYEIAPEAGTTEVTYYDSVEDLPAASTGDGDTGPEVGISVSETQLIETEQTETTLTFTLSEPPPEEGVTVLLNSADDTLLGSPLSQFDVLNAEIVGGDFPIPNSDSSGFFFNITEQTATITLAAFDELTADTPLPPDTFQEGIVQLTFALQSEPGYTIAPDAGEVTVTIADNPESQIFVNPSASGDILIESEGSVGTLSLSLGAPPPAEGVTVTLSADSLADFDTEAIEVEGGTLAAVRENELDITLTEQVTTVSLPILEDGIDEDNETATFTVEPGEGYETAEAVAEVAFFLADTPGEASTPEEIEGNSTLPTANALGLSADNPVISIRGEFSETRPEPGGRFFGFSEDVDFYSFTLVAGQTVALDMDGIEENADGIDNTSDDILLFPELFIFPALQDIPQQPDTELRLFDVDGNELAANNDGAAPGEDFSRDPFIEFTAETAGTYYVGVSQLGNRNYDPFIPLSGTGWTFPEVGVFYGLYDLTATLTEGGGTSDLTGTDAADILTGTDGDDVLNGLLGDDIYTGGAGADQFVLGIAQGVDTITDFEVGVDQISLGGLTPEGVKFFELSSDTLVLTASNELIGVVQGVTGLDSSVFA